MEIKALLFFALAIIALAFHQTSNEINPTARKIILAVISIIGCAVGGFFLGQFMGQ